MKLVIDNREPQVIIKYIEALNQESGNKIIIEIKSLDIGDYIFCDDTGEKTQLIIERKSLSDLESSIKDGRYSEQSYRLDKSNIHNHNIVYLLEGNIQNYKRTNFKNTIYSSMFSLNYFKGFSVICSHNQIETGEIIFNFICKLNKEKGRAGFYNNISPKNYGVCTEAGEEADSEDNDSNKQSSYLENVKASKKSFITTENIFELMLMQIPSISNVSASAISERYKNMQNLLDSLKNNPGDFENLKLSNGRKINKNIVDSIKKYLLL